MNVHICFEIKPNKRKAKKLCNKSEGKKWKKDAATDVCNTNRRTFTDTYICIYIWRASALEAHLHGNSSAISIALCRLWQPTHHCCCCNNAIIFMKHINKRGACYQKRVSCILHLQLDFEICFFRRHRWVIIFIFFLSIYCYSLSKQSFTCWLLPLCNLWLFLSYYCCCVYCYCCLHVP